MTVSAWSIIKVPSVCILLYVFMCVQVHMCVQTSTCMYVKVRGQLQVSLRSLSTFILFLFVT